MNQPLFAEVISTDEKSTHAVVWIFSKPVLREFTDENHRDKAQKWVEGWQAHLDLEWGFIQQTFTELMLKYTKSLLSNGVDRNTLGKAFQTLQVKT